MVELYQVGINEVVEVDNTWQELNAAKQNKTILKGSIHGIEEHRFGNTSDKTPVLVVFFNSYKGLIPLQDSGIDIPLNKEGKPKIEFNNSEKRYIRQQFKDLVGQEEPVIVTHLSVDEESSEKRVVLSRREAQEVLARITWGQITKEMIVMAKVRHIRKNGIVVDVNGISSFMPLRELSWGFVNDGHMVVKKGQSIPIKIMDVDKENKKIKISHRHTLPNPWPDCTTRYMKQNSYKGKVAQIIDKAVFVNLEPGVDVYCQHMKFEKLSQGDPVMVEILGFDKNKKNMWGNLTGKLAVNI